MVIVALSIFVGIFTAFIPHLIYFWFNHKITVLKPNRNNDQEIHPKIESIQSIELPPKNDLTIEIPLKTETNKIPETTSYKSSEPQLLANKEPEKSPDLTPTKDLTPQTNQTQNLTPTKTPESKNTPTRQPNPIPNSTPIKIPEPLDPLKIFKMPRKVPFEKVDRLADIHLPNAKRSFNAKPNYGKGAQILGHIAGGKLVGNTSLEAASPSNILSHTIDYLEKRSKQTIANKTVLIEKMRVGKNLSEIRVLSDFINATRNKMKGFLENKESILFPFGWKGKPGHAMFLEVRYESPTHCTVRVFNLGSGGKYHMTSDHKMMPFLDWKGVEITRFISSPFLQAIFELNPSLSKEDREYSKEDIYISCKRLLAPQEEKKQFSENEFPFEKWMSPQKSGICCWKSLAAFLSTYLSKSEYKAFMAEIKIDGIYKFAEDNCTSQTKDSDYFFEQVLKVTSSYIDKQIGKNHISDKYRQLALEQFEKANKLWVDGKKEENAAENSIIELNYKGPPIDHTALMRLYTDSTLSTNKSGLNTISPKSIEILHDIRKLTKDVLEMGDTRFGELALILEKDKDLWKNEGLAIHQGLLEFMKMLPSKEDEWKQKVSPEQAKVILNHTLAIAKIAFSSWYGIPTSWAMQPEHIYIFKKLVYVQKILNKIAFMIPGELFHLYKTKIPPLGAWDKPFDYFIAEESFESNMEGSLCLNDYNNCSRLTVSSFWTTLKKYNPNYVATLESKFPNLSQHKLVCTAMTDKDLPNTVKASLHTQLFLQAALSSLDLSIGKNSIPTDFEPNITFTELDTTNVKFVNTILNEKKEIYNSQLYKLGSVIAKPIYATLEKNYLSHFLSIYDHTHSEKLKETLVRAEDFPEEDLKKWSKEDVQLLLRIFPSLETVHNDLLAYCKKEKPTAIYDPDFQRLFIRALLKGKPGVQLQHLRSWLQDELTALIRGRSDEFLTACFLLRAIRYTYWMSPDSELPDNHFKQIETLKRKAEKTSAARLVRLEEVVSLSKKKFYSDEELLTLARNLCILNHYPLNSNDIEPLWLFEVGKANLLVANAISHYIEKDSNQINQVLKTLDSTQQDLVWKKEGEGKFSSSEGDIFYTHTCRFELKKFEFKETYISPKILEMRHFKTLFPTTVKAKLVELQDKCYYEFTDPATKRLTQVSLNGEISQQIENAWWIWTSPEDLYFYDKKENGSLKFLLGSAPLTFSCRIYRSKLEIGEFICEDPISHETLYKVTRPSIYTFLIKNIKTELFLSVPSKNFEPMTHPVAIEEWFDKHGKIQKCSLPTLGLNFTVKDSKFFCDEIPEFYLHTPKQAGPFGILLMNGKGKYRGLLPQIEKISALDRKESLIPQFIANYSLKTLEAGKEKYFQYEFSKEGVPATNNPEAELYDASLCALFQDYKTAFRLLQKHRGQLLSFVEHPALGKYLRQTIEFLKIVGNKTPHAIALTVFSYYLLLRNSLNYPRRGTKPDFSDEDLQALSLSYQQFLKNTHHIHFISFLKDEELFLIDHLDPTKENVLFQDRKEFLQGKDRKSVPRPIKTLPTHEETATLDNLNFGPVLHHTSFQTTPQTDICEIKAITRPALTKNTASYYHIAVAGTAEQKQWLEAALIFAELDPQEKITAHFLKLVLKYTDRFSIPKVLPYDTEWISKTSELLKELVKLDKRENIASTVKPENYSQPPFAFFSSFKPLEPIEGALSFQIKIPEKFVSLADLVKNSVDSKSESKKIPQELREFLKKGQSSSSPMEQAEYNRLVEDLKEYENEKEIVHTIKDKAQFSKALQDNGEVNQLDTLKKKILDIANAVPKDNVQLNFLKLQGHIQLFNLDELLINFARQKPELLQKNNPSLSKSALIEIYQLCAEYLLIATNQQQKARVNKALEKNLDQEAASLATAKRAYVPNSTDPRSLAYLVFEYFSDMLLRPDQVALQAKFLDELDNCYAQEMIMGSGKSKVISILLALLRADGKSISTIVVGNQFLNDVAPHTSEILLKTFQQTLATIHFDRGTPLTVASLQSIIQILESVRHNQNSLIVTSKTLQCLVLSFIEEWINFSTTANNQLPPELELLKAIILKIKKEGNLLIDELDTVLNVLHTVSFSLGKKERPKSCHLKINRCIYDILYGDAEIKLLAQLESDPQPNANAPPLTKEIYKTQIIAPLAKKFLINLHSVKFEKDQEQEAASEISKANQEALIDFICQDPNLEKGKVKASIEAYNSLSHVARDFISEAALEIGHLLENTLTQTCNEKYGIQKGDLFSIPFSAANTPCKGSEFASHKVTCNKTRQSIAKYKFELSVVQLLIEKIMKRIHTDTENKEGGLEDLLDKWEKKLGLLFSQKDTDWKAVSDKINSSLTSKMDFLDDFVFPEMEYYSEKITSTSQTIAEMSVFMKGFTGTLWNFKTFHSKFIASPEKGTDSKTLALLFSHSNRPVYEIEKVQGPFCEMLIDAGGYLKMHEPIEAARIFSKEQKKPVVFYHNRVQTVTDGIKEKPFKDSNLQEGEFITFLDQANTTGADVKKKHNAKGLVTIKAGMTKRDLLQAVWRLRGLAKGQTIEWGVDKKTAGLIRASLKLSENTPLQFCHILSYAIKNESEQLGKDDFESFMQQINNVKQQILLDTLLSDATVAEKRKILSELKSSWCKPESGSNPSKNFCTIPVMIKTAAFLEEQQKQEISQINGLSLSAETKKKAGDAIIEIVKRYKVPGMLPERIQSPQATADESVEVEKDTQQDVEVDIDVVKALEKPHVKLEYLTGSMTIRKRIINDDGTISIVAENSGTQILYDCGNFGRLTLHDYLSKHPTFKTSGIEKFFDGISVSLNFLEKHMQTEKLVQNYYLHGSYQKEFDYVVFENGEAILISQQEAEVLLNKYDIFSIKSGEFLRKERPLLTNEQLEHVLKIRFLAGDSNFNEEEIAQLERGLKQYPKLTDFYKNVIIKNNHLRATEFKNSTLAKLFVNLAAR